MTVDETEKNRRPIRHLRILLADVGDRPFDKIPLGACRNLQVQSQHALQVGLIGIADRPQSFDGPFVDCRVGTSGQFGQGVDRFVVFQFRQNVDDLLANIDLLV